jgi:hypothetical protein
MSGNDNHDSIPSKKDSELKNPDRRQVLGVAVVAAAFTAGQIESAAGQGKKSSPAKKGAPEPYGGLVDPAHYPGETKPGTDGYQPVSQFHDLSAKLVYRDGAEYRRKVSAYAKSLRKKMNLPDSEFMHVVRIQPKPGGKADVGWDLCCCS